MANFMKATGGLGSWSATQVKVVGDTKGLDTWSTQTQISEAAFNEEVGLEGTLTLTAGEPANFWLYGGGLHGEALKVACKEGAGGNVYELTDSGTAPGKDLRAFRLQSNQATSIVVYARVGGIHGNDYAKPMRVVWLRQGTSSSKLRGSWSAFRPANPSLPGGYPNEGLLWDSAFSGDRVHLPNGESVGLPDRRFWPDDAWVDIRWETVRSPAADAGLLRDQVFYVVISHAEVVFGPLVRQQIMESLIGKAAAVGAELRFLPRAAGPGVAGAANILVPSDLGKEKVWSERRGSNRHFYVIVGF